MWRRLLQHVKLDQITLKGGTIHFIDASREPGRTSKAIDAVVSAPGIAGPWRARGIASYKSRPFDIAINTGQWQKTQPFKSAARGRRRRLGACLQFRRRR